jgi:hypothetical protein
MIASLHRRHRGLNVHLILGGDNRTLAKLTFGGQFLPICETMGIINIVIFGKPFAPDWIRFGHGDKTDFVGMLHGVRGIGACTALAGADQDKFKWTGHNMVPYCFEYFLVVVDNYRLMLR